MSSIKRSRDDEEIEVEIEVWRTKTVQENHTIIKKMTRGEYKRRCVSNEIDLDTLIDEIDGENTLTAEYDEEGWTDHGLFECRIVS